MKTATPIDPPASGFTLVELVVSGALMSIILVSAYLCLSAGFSGQKLIEPRLEVFQNARVAMALVTADLRAAGPLSPRAEFVGMRRRLGEVEADNLDFATHNYTPRRPREGDYCQMSYFLNPDPATGRYTLWRRRNPIIALDPFSGGRREEIATGLVGLRFEYYDGWDWYDSWGDAEGRGKPQFSLRVRNNLSGLPEAVRITMFFDPSAAKPRQPGEDIAATEPPLVFQTVARLELAGASQRGAAGGGSSGGTVDGSPAPGVPGGGGQ